MECKKCHTIEKEHPVHICSACGETTELPLKSALWQDDSKCFACRQPFGLTIKVGTKFVLTKGIRMLANDLLLCSICNTHVPEHHLPVDELVQHILSKRIYTPVLLYRPCEYCKDEFGTTNPHKKFCSNSCRSQAWLKKGGKKD